MDPTANHAIIVMSVTTTAGADFLMWAALGEVVCWIRDVETIPVGEEAVVLYTGC